MRSLFFHWTMKAGAVVVVVIGAYFLQQQVEYMKMHMMPAGLRPFDVNGPLPTCGRWKDTMPKTRDPEAYRLYINARKLWRSKIEWQLTRQEALSILHDVQTAADQGDWGARALMAYFYRTGLGPLDTNNVLDKDADKLVAIVRSAVAAGQAWGYYDLGVAHEHGYGGAALDSNIAWAYFLRAAELGSPEAQMALADAYRKAERRDADAAMIMCAYKQGHGPAAYKMGVRADVSADFAASMEYHQAGTRFGSKESAAALMFLFDTKDWSSRDTHEQAALRALNVLPDIDRSSRYSQISDALDLDPDLRLNRLDQVLPLPPAEVPNWNGIRDAIDPEPDGLPTY